MYGSFQSSQYVEVLSKDDSRQVEFQIVLRCVTRSTPGRLSGPPEDCYPPEGAEFEVEHICIVNENDDPTPISIKLFEALCGDGMAEQIIEDAMVEADETGDF